MSKALMTVRIPPDLLDTVRNRAKAEGISQGELVERALRRELGIDGGGGADINARVRELELWQSEVELQQLWDRTVTNNLSSPSPDYSEDQLLQLLQPVLQQIAARRSVQNTVVYSTAPAPQEPTALLVNTVPLHGSDTSLTQEELLSRLSNRIRQSLDLPTILQTAVCEVRIFFAADRAVIYQFDANWCGQVILEDVGEPWFPTLGEAADDCFPRENLERYRNGRIKAINNVLEAGLDSNHLQFLQRLRVQANLTVPIMVCDQLWGLLIVHQCSHPRVWKQEEGNLLNRLAIQLGIAIQQSDLYTQAKQSALQAQVQAQQLRESEALLNQQTQNLQQAFQELQSLQLQLVQSEKMSSLGQLVAGIAHEINNPVNFIHGNLSYVQTYAQDLLSFVQLYQKHHPNPAPELQTKADEIDLEFLQEDLAKILNSMEMGTDRILQIVLSLRNFSRMDEAEFKAVDIHEGIDSTLMILQHRLQERPERLAIEVMRDHAKLPLVECYPGLLNQVLMNLLANAIDALEDAGATRTFQDIKDNLSQISIRTCMIDHQWVEIVIADNGPGIPEKVKERIFDPFFTTKPIGKGTGLGLSIS